MHLSGSPSAQEPNTGSGLKVSSTTGGSVPRFAILAHGLSCPVSKRVTKCAEKPPQRREGADWAEEGSGDGGGAIRAHIYMRRGGNRYNRPRSLARRQYTTLQKFWRALVVASAGLPQMTFF